MYDFSLLRKQLSEWTIHLDDEQEKLLLRYYEMLIERNRGVNLTTITSWEDVCIKHFLDSAALLYAPLPLCLENKEVIDIGSGAGFPGLILKIFCPSIQLTLLDALSKRVCFLSEVIKELQLENVSRETFGSKSCDTGGCLAIHGRAEELAFVKKDNKTKHNSRDTGNKLKRMSDTLSLLQERIDHKNRIGNMRESFDLVTARAVSKLCVLSEYALPLLRTGGCFAAYKSGKVSGEIKEAERAVALLGGKIIRSFKYRLPFTDIERSIVIIQKIKPTPDEYPRQSGLIKKKPL